MCPHQNQIAKIIAEKIRDTTSQFWKISKGQKVDDREVVKPSLINGLCQQQNAKIIAEKIRDMRGTQLVNFGKFPMDTTS